MVSSRRIHSASWRRTDQIGGDELPLRHWTSSGASPWDDEEDIQYSTGRGLGGLGGLNSLIECCGFARSMDNFALGVSFTFVGWNVSYIKGAEKHSSYNDGMLSHELPK